MSDNHLVYVSPQLYLNSKDKWKLSEQDFNFSLEYVDSSAYLPILKADLPKFVESLDGKKTSKFKKTSIRQNSLTQGKNLVSSPENSTGSTIQPNETTSKKIHEQLYISLQDFAVDNNRDQSFLVAIVNVPMKLSNTFIEQFLIYISGEKIKNWTSCSSVDSQTLYVKFKDMSSKELFEIISFWNIALKKLSQKITSFNWELHYDASLKKSVEENRKEPDDSIHYIVPLDDVSEYYITLLNTENSKRLDNKVNVGATASAGPEEEYRIDMQLLGDLPANELGQLCKDILNFRTKAFIDERTKITKQNEEDNKRNRQKMDRIVEQIKKSCNVAGADEDMGDSEESEEEEETEETDEAILKRQESLSNEELDRKYTSLLTVLKRDIEPKIEQLKKHIGQNTNYTADLFKNRDLYLKELSRLTSDPYYNYSFNRVSRKIEQEFDVQDRAAHPHAVLDIFNKYTQPKPESEESETPTTGIKKTVKTSNGETTTGSNIKGTDTKIKINLALKNKIDKYDNDKLEEAVEMSSSATESDEEVAKIRRVKNILPFDEETMELRIKKLRESKIVDELVNEYLGVYENELVEYILDNISVHKNKELLLKDLRETFDSDANTIVETIWSSEILKH
ncbi:hypothetical protein TPHA_0K01400 [Tetrapisispora phaffii CBS 4417]|uniref:U1 small nuclear ribonucleoprotein component SNU71 n=1 Tax=Tetrapisispora phaffii (strain ATCC 24235 / CBS 4417 / NBRC 1672 / NRRL Y-8282 / UCD 70-5) TaxID=1071381 RepID=G8BZE5_TETPH|nr:hypothetical protein TPHA_0K01400 [Tetrapisispora phaffii CBS 4417]CCE65273.1 hypothetical protein TPHA_0K01400 [Tetrapisispora phaffii CBS 4417]